MGLADRSRPERQDNAAEIEACRRGDRRALDALFRAEAPALQRLLLRLVGPGPEVEDLLEATFSAAMEAFPRFRGEASVERWLACIATRTAYQHFRYAKHRRHTSLELLRGASEPLDGQPLPDAVAENRRRVERLYHHLGKIGPKKRIPFILHFLEGRPIDEVAAIVGANAVVTKGRIFLARRALLARASKDPVLKDLMEAGGTR